MKNIFLLCITFFLFSCKSQDKLKVNLLVENNSDELIDSISIYFFEQKKTYKKIINDVVNDESKKKVLTLLEDEIFIYF